jgi:hypothetical protein
MFEPKPPKLFERFTSLRDPSIFLYLTSKFMDVELFKMLIEVEESSLCA